jgi:hypothetical protein
MRLRVVCWFFDRRPFQLSLYVAAILSCVSPNLLAQGLTEPVTVSRVGPEGGRINSIVVDPSDSNTVYAASNTGAFKSTNAGTTWSYSGLITAITFDVTTVSIGSSYTTTVVGSNLNNDTYFDVQVRAPDSAEDIVVLNWQVGTSESHSVPAGILPGTWTIDGVRAHQDPENHAGSFAQVSAAITVSP